ncbi:unnamed protein product, partial [Staurois parvus]
IYIYFAKRIGTPLQIIGFRCSNHLHGCRCKKSSTMQTASANICERMGPSQKLSEFRLLSEFKRGTVIGCHLGNKSIHEISFLLNVQQSTVSNIIPNWKQLGTAATQPPSGRPHKMTERGQRMLERTVHRTVCRVNS